MVCPTGCEIRPAFSAGPTYICQFQLASRTPFRFKAKVLLSKEKSEKVRFLFPIFTHKRRSVAILFHSLGTAPAEQSDGPSARIDNSLSVSFFSVPPSRKIEVHDKNRYSPEGP